MFKQVLKEPRKGPLFEERRRFLIYCAEQQMSRWTLRTIDIYLVVVARELRLAKRPGEFITQIEIEAAAKGWAKRLPRLPRALRQAQNRFKGRAMRWLRFLGRLQPTTTAPPPYADCLANFADFMRLERGLLPRTILGHCQETRQFLARLTETGMQLETISVAQVEDILLWMIRERGYQRVTVQGMASALRVFFRYAEERKLCRPGIAKGVLAPRVYRNSAIPAGPAWDDVKLVIAAAEGDKQTDIRDRAILMLLAMYGLRRGELVALRLEDFDWSQETFTVRSAKRRRPRIYPLCRSVGHAVLRYLREARPQSCCREVFLSLRAPFRPLHSGSAIYSAVSHRLRALGVKSPHYGPHALRHACATHLLAMGLSLKEIGDHLGHRSPESTRVYAKVDLVALRAVADFDLGGLQ
jgi:site-specific recombinase XerD